ncbi:polyamine ABC transporter substrate-binding protein [Pseudomonas sp. LRF_L74]|uniref:polyamine ABC transporter substrate-binding protein n=1 Tax=Pseudomonas sp. LRF_L74 TaxID=3369422 RepID=UPI003F5EE842
MNKFMRSAAVAAAWLSVATGLSAAEAHEVRIYNWIEYLPPEVLADFEKETGIHPVYDVFDNVEMLEAKLLTGNSGYDVVFPGSSNIGRLIVADAFEPLDRAKLPNWSHLDSGFMTSLEAAGDKGNRYAVPYLWGTTLIGYNVDKVKAVLGAEARMDTWDVIFAKDNLAKLSSCGVGFIDAANEIVPIALHYKGLDPNSEKREDYKQAQELLLSIRPYVTYFNSSRYGMDLANGDICVAVGWSGGVAIARQLADAAGKNVKVEMALPKEGAPMWSDVMAIPAKAPHAEEAHAFINYILRPDVIARVSNRIGYPNPNKDATALVDAAIRNNPNMYVPEDVYKTLFPLQPISPAAERVRTRTWTMVKTNR